MSSMEDPFGAAYEATVKEGSFQVRFLVPSRVLLFPEFEQIVWDEVLRMAHERDIIPVGSIMITHEPYVRGDGGNGEGIPEPWFLMTLPDSDIVIINAEVMTGLTI